MSKKHCFYFELKLGFNSEFF